MKSDNFTLQSSLEANYLNVQLQEPVQLDEIVIKVVKTDCPGFVIPFRIVEINDSISLKYKLTDAVALEYANMTLCKTEFIKLYQNLLMPFIMGNNWFLDYHYYCIDAKYVFLDKVTSEARFIYIPENSYRNTDEEILQFFKDAFIHITITDDANFQVRLFQYFTKGDVTLTDLYRLIQEEGKWTGSIPNPSVIREDPIRPPKVPITQQLSMTPEADILDSGVSSKGSSRGGLFGGNGKKEKDKNSFSSEEAVPINSLSDSSDEVMQALFGDNRKKRKEKDKSKKKSIVQEEQNKKKSGGFNLFGKKKEQEKAVEISQSAPLSGNLGTGNLSASGTPGAAINDIPFVPMNDMGDKTEIFAETCQMGAYLELMDSPIPNALTRIDLNFKTTYITIGRSSSDEVQPDIVFNREFTRISRRHARIENRGGSYFVIDLGSANHTLLNGKILVPNHPYQLQDGGELTFTDNKPVRYRIHL